jgi:Uma2 family endonuclease
MSDFRVRLARRPRYVYFDVTVVCGTPAVDPEDTKGETFTNPRLVVEVLSPTTESYDRKTKFDRYREVSSFREYVLVSQDVSRVETFFVQDDGTWGFDVAIGTEGAIRLRSLNVDLSLAEVFAGVEFPPASPEPMDDAQPGV